MIPPSWRGGAHLSVTASDLRAPTETVPSENPHVEAALAAPARRSSDDAIEKRMVGDLWLWLRDDRTGCGQTAIISFRELGWRVTWLLVGRCDWLL